MALNGFPYGEIVFGADGLPVDPAQRGTAPPMAGDPAITDLLLLIHGWQDDIDQARGQYSAFTAAMAQVGGAPAGLGVLGVFWPSKQFGASSDTATAETAASIAADPQARVAYTEAVRSSVSAASVASWADPGDQQDLFFGMDAGALFDKLAEGAADPVRTGMDDVLNLATYYEMKARSGVLGTKGLAPLLAAARTERPDLRLHLAGHSFGARAIAAALSAGGVLPVTSAVLIQGAFSHYGFAKHWDGIHDGLFRPGMLGSRVAGPVVTTYSAHDEVLADAYALASRLAGQDDSVLGPIGGPHDKFGAIGVNGALATPESVWQTMQAVGGRYAFTTGTVCNLDAKAYIPNHFSVTGPEVAQALVAAVNFG